MTTEIKAKNFNLNTEQEEFVREKSQKIKELANSLHDNGHVIHINFEHIESKAKDENIICTITLNIKGHKEIRVERSASTVEKAMQEAKKVAVLDITKMKAKINPSKIHK